MSDENKNYPQLQFSKNWTNPNDFPTIETDEVQVRADMQILHDETQSFLNDTLIPRIVADAATEEARAEAEAARNVWEPYDATRTYVPGNKVYLAGSSYVNKVSCTGVYPTDALYWQVIARGGTGGGGSGGGFSPIVDLSKTDGVTTMTVTDAAGTQSVQILDGTPGATGPQGAPGQSVEVTVSREGKVSTVTFTDSTGVKSFEIMDGADGAPGPDGPQGPAGYTPIKGTDYYTEADRQELIADIAAEVSAPPTEIDFTSWASGAFEVTHSDGTAYTGSVTFDSANRPTSITLNGHTLTLTLPEVE